MLHGPTGLPVVAADRSQVVGWITSQDVIDAMATRLASYPGEVAQANLAAEWATDDPAQALRTPPDPLRGYQVAELTIAARDHDRRVADIDWTPGTTPVALTRRNRTQTIKADTVLNPGDRLILLVPAPPQEAGGHAGPRTRSRRAE